MSFMIQAPGQIIKFTMQCYNTVAIAVNVANENELQMAQKSKLHE